MLPLLGYLSIPFLVPLNKLQNLIHVINKGSIIRNDWAHQKENHENGSLFDVQASARSVYVTPPLNPFPRGRDFSISQSQSAELCQSC